MSGVNAHALVARMASTTQVRAADMQDPAWHRARHYPLLRAHALLAWAVKSGSGVPGACSFVFLPNTAAAAHLREYTLGGEPVLPPAALLEMAAAAAAALAEGSTGLTNPNPASTRPMLSGAIAAAVLPADEPLLLRASSTSELTCDVSPHGSILITWPAAPRPGQDLVHVGRGAGLVVLQARSCVKSQLNRPAAADAAPPARAALPDLGTLVAQSAEPSAFALLARLPADVRADAYMCHPASLAALLSLAAALRVAVAAHNSAHSGLTAARLYDSAWSGTDGPRSGMLQGSGAPGMAACWHGGGGMLEPLQQSGHAPCRLMGPAFGPVHEHAERSLGPATAAPVSLGARTAAAEVVYDVEWQTARCGQAGLGFSPGEMQLHI